MSRLEQVIADVKAARHGKYRAWIYDDNEKIQDNVYVGEVLNLLEELKEYEIDITDEEIRDIVKNSEDSGNTYNWNANISNDINWHTKGNKTVIMVHLRGDIRCGYTDYFAVELECGFLSLYSLESATQHKDIPNTSMVADIELFAEGYEVYDYEVNMPVGMFYDTELEDLLMSISSERG